MRESPVFALAKSIVRQHTNRMQAQRKNWPAYTCEICFGPCGTRPRSGICDSCWTGADGIDPDYDYRTFRYRLQPKEKKP